MSYLKQINQGAYDDVHSVSTIEGFAQRLERLFFSITKVPVKGQAIVPLYKTVPEAALHDLKLYEMLALVDAIRVGRVREKKLAVSELKKRIL